MMNKIIGAAVLLLCFCSCVKDNDAIYYPVGNVDIEKGGPALEVGSNSILVAESYNEEDYVLDTLAQYPGDPTLGKLTFMINLKNQSGTREVAEFNGVGKSVLTMSLGYKDGNYPVESQIPVYTSADATASLIRQRLSRKSLCVKEGNSLLLLLIHFAGPGHLI